MKQTLKKIMSIALMMICVFVFTACGAAKEEEKIDETLSMNMTTTAEGLADAVVNLSDEEIASYKESGDSFTENAMEAWESNKDDLGEYKGMGTSVVDEITDGYSVTIPAEFSIRKAEFVFTFDDQGTPTGMAVNPEYTMGEKMEQALMNTLMGVGIVFVMLVFLSLLISLFKYVPKLEEAFTKKGKKEEPKAEKKAEPAPAAAPAVSVPATDDKELIAVIAAAIAAAEGTSTDSFVVRSIKKINRKKW
ncbi:MAG: OadG family transporter subunit [Eubacteriales bacterium]|nr:OadG family transporter subunit [Eubacteriales bacterium]